MDASGHSLWHETRMMNPTVGTLRDGNGAGNGKMCSTTSDKRSSELATVGRSNGGGGGGTECSTKSVRSNAKSTRSSSVTAGNPNSNNNNNNKINTFVQIIPSQRCCISRLRASEMLMECLGQPYQWLPLSRYRHAMTAPATTTTTAKLQLPEPRQKHQEQRQEHQRERQEHHREERQQHVQQRQQHVHVQQHVPHQQPPKQLGPKQQRLSHQPNESQFAVFAPRHFSGHFGHLLLRSILLLALVQCLTWHAPIVAAAPQSCILCSKSDLPPATNERSRNYEEFVFEHQVTRKQATEALNALNGSFYDGPAEDKYYCKSITCSDEVMKYCLGPQFINDHCLCEFGHIEEGLPFIPHTCYVGEKMMKPSMGSCYYYEELKECCCSPALAMQWRHISGSSSRPSRGNYILVASLFSLAVATAAGTFV